MKFITSLSIRSFLLIFFSICATQVFAQAVGDYRSNTATGNWNVLATWQRCNSITPVTWATPTVGQGYPGQNAGTLLVTIRNGHTVTLNVTPANNIGSLTVGGGTSGTLILGDGGPNENLIVSGNVIVNNGAAISAGEDGVFTIGGNLINNNVFDMNVGGNDYDVVFNGSTNQTFSGTGATSDFNDITINNSGVANNNIVEIMPSYFTVVAGFLTLTQGIIKMSGSYTLTNTFFNTTGPTINADEGIWLNNPNVIVTGQNGDTQLFGLLRITQGTYNVGATANWWFLYNTGAIVIIEGGAFNIGSAFAASNPTSSTITYTQSGGVVTANIFGNTGAFGPIPSFGIETAGSTFNMSGGSIVLERLNNAYADFYNIATTNNVTGGTLQVGNASSPVPTFSYWVYSTAPIYNLLVNNTNSPTAEIRTNVTVLNDVTISTGASLDASLDLITNLSNNLTVGHNFTNNGTFIPRLGTVTFNGTVLQDIGGSSMTTFKNLTINNTLGNTTAGVTLQQAAAVDSTLTLTSGHITTTSNLLTLNAGSSVNGANYAARTSGGSANSFINGPLKKIGGTNFLFPVGEVNRGIRFCGVSGTGTATDSFTGEFISGSASNMAGGITASGLIRVSKCEYWTIATTAGSPSVNVTLSWNPASICNAAAYVTQLSSLVVAHYGTSWDSYGGNIDAGSNVSTGSITWSGVTTFSPFSLGSTSASENPLPVKLVDVKAYHTGDRNRVEWTNLTEIDVVAYEVERSLNGTQFTSMASVAARSNTNDKESYYEYDVQTAPVTYYRIKVTSRDGKIIYSPIVKVATNLTVKQDIVLYPNPVTGKQFTMQMNSAAGDYYVKIYSANGQIVKTETLKHPGGAYAKTIELPAQLQAGQYYMQVSGGEKILTSKFIVQ